MLIGRVGQHVLSYRAITVAHTGPTDAVIDTWPGSATANHNPMFTIPPTDGSGFMFIVGSGSCAVTD